MSKINNNLLLTVNEPAKLKFSMGNGVPGSYDGLKLKPEGGSDWRRPPSNVPLLEGKFFVPQGTQDQNVVHQHLVQIEDVCVQQNSNVI